MRNNYRAQPKNRSRLGLRVREHHKRSRKPREEDISFLNRNLRFNPELICPKAEAFLTEIIGGRRINTVDKWRLDLSCLIGNLLEGENSRPRRPISISKNANDWHTPTRYGYPRYKTIDLVNMMIKQDLIGMKLGYKSKRRSRYTRIWALPKLLELHPTLSTAVEIRPPKELVELRELDTRKLIDYSETREGLIYSC